MTNEMCAAPGCTNPIQRRRRGRPPIYCSTACRPSHRAGPGRWLVVEVAGPDPDAIRPGRAWHVRLRRGSRIVTIATDLGWPSAHALANDIRELTTNRPRGAAID
ncbi:MAG: hypothetical protein KY440_12955 [Actinobacteria bacterium]|nr:hypothetical protein [Actinomycetota bacterium]